MRYAFLPSPPGRSKSVKKEHYRTIQDAGSPHIGCDRECCRDLFDHPDPDRMLVSLGIVDPANQKTYIIEATPDMPRQLKALKNEAGFMESETPDGIFLTHAHIGHYTGLMYFGREALGGQKIPVYAMPRMKSFLETNGPWEQLVTLENISLMPLTENETIQLTPSIQITPIRVPHRDEYSETVGYRVEGPAHSLLFIPDIDKWGKWDKDILEEIHQVDYALLDGSFYDGEEINYRDISEIPHPFLIESLEYFAPMAPEDRNKVHFIHFNHTNPILSNDRQVIESITGPGYRICELHQQFTL